MNDKSDSDHTTPSQSIIWDGMPVVFYGTESTTHDVDKVQEIIIEDAPFFSVSQNGDMLLLTHRS